jgi:hypothetical protein
MADLSLITDPTRIGNQWVWPDGTTLPVVSGGDGPDLNAILDASLGAEEGDDPADTPAPAAAPASAPAAATAPDAASSGDDLGKFGEHADYIKQLRAESARYRTERNQARDDAGRYTSAFEGLDDAMRESLLALPAYLKGTPDQRAEAAAWMNGLANSLTAAEQAEVRGDIADASDEAGRSLSPSEVEKIVNAKLAERDQQAAVDKELGSIRSQVEALGFAWESKEAHALLAVALDEGGDIAKAHAVMAGWAQSAVDKFVDSRKADAGSPTPAPTTGGGTGAAPVEIHSIKDAAKGVNAMLAAQGFK